MDETSSPDYEFGGFRLDTSLHVLVSPRGEPLPLPSRAFAALRYLVERAGEIVDKSALMAAVWPTTVVAENNLNQCILALRKALGESAGERRFILTVPGRGYKFVAPVTIVPHGHPGPAPMVPQAPATTRSRVLWLTVAASAAVVMVLGVTLSLWFGRNQPVTNPAEYVQLTDVTDGAISPVLSADGHLLAFIRNGSAFMGSGQVWLKVLPNGEPVKLTDANGPVWAPAFSPDGAHVVYTAIDLRNGSWNTWTVPVTGGAATQLLPNTQGLTYIGPREVLYSEFDDGLHLGVATSLDDRSLHRQVYVPSHERGMAHFSHLSPDRKSVLVVEMVATGAFERCRLAPFDGSVPGYAVGPRIGACLAAAWSPDGKWMYFSDNASGSSHLWRQRFPNGSVEQITFGPNEEQTVFPSPDGRSLLTSIGLTQSTLWLHEADAERVLSTEGRVFAPWLSPDSQRVYFLTTPSEAARISLSRMDTATGRQESLLPGFNPIEYDISPDEQQVAFTILRDGEHQIWLAPLDRHTSPTLLVRDGDEPQFGGQYVFFRRVGAHVNYLHRIRTDGDGESQLLPDPILEMFCAAPDGNAVVVARPAAEGNIAAWVVPVDNTSAARVVNKGYAPSRWSHDGKAIYVGLNVQQNLALSGSTRVLPVGPDDLPLTSVTAASADGALIPKPGDNLSVGADPSVYVFLKSERRQNIYRIPLH
jgi:DNA-binding winged helix-turn-helix (wHTH) protein/dipeptidyl aminopeptidase/acylaminoacyl peptidase